MTGALTYALLSSAFLVVALIVFIVAIAVTRDAPSVLRRWWGPVLVAAVVVLVLTAVFDNVMIAAGFFSYSGDKTAGLMIGRAPLEDFSYPLAAIILVPSLWVLTRPRRSVRR